MKASAHGLAVDRDRQIRRNDNHVAGRTDSTLDHARTRVIHRAGRLRRIKRVQLALFRRAIVEIDQQDAGIDASLGLRINGNAPVVDKPENHKTGQSQPKGEPPPKSTCGQNNIPEKSKLSRDYLTRSCRSSPEVVRKKEPGFRRASLSVGMSDSGP